MKNLSVSFVALCSFVFSMPANAGGLIQGIASAWTFSESVDPLLNVPSCRAVTTQVQGPFGAEFSVSYPKDRSALPIILLKIRGSNIDSQLAQVRVSSGAPFSFVSIAKSGTGATRSDLFWYVPTNFSTFYDKLIADDSLEVVLNPKAQPAKFIVSLNGSGAALRSVLSCVKTALATDFLKDFNQATNGIPMEGARTPEAMYENAKLGFQAFYALPKIETQLQELRDASLSLVRREQELLSEVEKNRANLAKTAEELQAVEKAIESERSRLPNIEASINSAQEELAQAQANFDQKESNLNELQRQMAPFDRERQQWETNVSHLKQQIAVTNEMVSTGQAKIDKLNAEKSKTEGETQALDRELRVLNRRLLTLNTRVASFDIDVETDKILREDGRFQNLEARLESFRQALNAKTSELRSVEQSESATIDEIARCKQSNQNCTALEKRLVEIRRKKSVVQQSVLDLERQIQATELSISELRNQTRQRAVAELDALLAQRQETKEAVEAREQAIEQNKDKIARLNTEILHLQKEFQEAQVLLPKLRAQLADAVVQLERSIQAQGDQAKRIGLEEAKKQHTIALSALVQKKQSLAKLSADKEALVGKINSLVAKQNNLNADSAKLQAAREKLEQDRLALQQQLEPVRLKEQELLKLKTYTAATYQANKVTYQFTWKELLQSLR